MPPAKRSGRASRGKIAEKEEEAPTRSTRGNKSEPAAEPTRGRRGPEEKVGTRGRGRRASEPPAAAEPAAAVGRGAAAGKRKRELDGDATKGEPDVVSDDNSAKRAVVEQQLDSALDTMKKQRSSLADGVEPLQIQATDTESSGPLSGRGRRASAKPPLAAAGDGPRLTKAQELKLRESLTAAAEKKREIELAKMAEDEGRTFAQEDKILKQAKGVQKRYDQDTLVRRMTRYAEPPRKKTHWDYLLQEMEWMANDFRHERKWKIANAKKVGGAVMKYHKSKATQSVRNEKVQEANLKKVASRLSREVRTFWGQVGKLVVYKHEVQIEQIRQQHMEKHMDFMVGQTERYSKSLAENINRPASAEAAPADASDTDFKPLDSEGGVDDETTIDQEEGDGSLQTAEQTAVQEMEVEGSQPITDVLAKYGVSKEAVDKGEIPERADADSAANTEAPTLGTGVQSEAEAEHGKLDNAEDDDLSFLVDDTLELTEEEKNIQIRQTNRMKRATVSARAIQPAGYTLDTAGDTKPLEVPFIIKAQLREYQHVALQWMMALYDKRLNGILADEMGLGKTLMTISMLAYLATDRGFWGPHLIVVPTSVMLNWEIEFKKWAPAFKVLTYYGSQKERKEKRVGWSKPNFFHICITSYQLVVQDQHVFRRKKWGYLILDEAHHIKNFQSQRWQTMLNFNAKRRLLLTGTPLQNNLMELWSLMHFLMPHIFASHKEFKDWFSNPLSNSAGQNSNSHLVQRLHGILRPFILRRLKSQVEQQLPGKMEHMVPCPLSPRQRVLYEEYMQRSDTRKCLSGGNYVGIMNVVMQLRKVCNHPDLFEVRPIVSPFDVPAPVLCASKLTATILDHDPFVHSTIVQSASLVQLLALEHMSSRDAGRCGQLHVDHKEMLRLAGLDQVLEEPPENLPLLAKLRFGRRQRYRESRIKALESMAAINAFRCQDGPVWGYDLLQLLQMQPFSTRKETVREGPLYRDIEVHRWWNCRAIVTAAQNSRLHPFVSECLQQLCKSFLDRAEEMMPTVKRIVMTIMKARSAPATLELGSRTVTINAQMIEHSRKMQLAAAPYLDVVRPYEIRKQLYFPDKRLVQFDCGKLQRLDMLLRELKNGGHRCLLFTQMSKMLDIMEHFLNLYGYTYLRLDGSTKPDERQKLMDRFNGDPRFFIFILSTRAGGVGINLTGADTVIFYDSDWNPSMDAQAQDRCHRIGQTREVHIYRLISEHTVEENILAKSKQKANLNAMVLQDGNFNAEAFQSWGSKEVKSLFDSDVVEQSSGGGDGSDDSKKLDETDTATAAEESADAVDIGEVQSAMESVEEEADIEAAKRAQRESAAADEDFKEDKVAGSDKVNMEHKARQEFLLSLKQGRQGKASTTFTSPRDGTAVEFDWETDLLPIQKYGMEFLVKVYPMVDTRQSVEQLDYQEQEWELDKLKQIQEEAEAEIDEDDDVLYYHVGGTSMGREAELAELRNAYLEAQEIAETELAKQQQVLVVGPPTTVMLEPEVEDPKPAEDYASSVGVPNNSGRGRSNNAGRGGGRPPPGGGRRRPGGHYEIGDGDGLFNGGRTNRDRKRPGANNRRPRPELDGHDMHHIGLPWSDKQDFALVFAVSRFGENWMLVSEVVSKSPAMGPWRSRDQCLARFRSLAQDRHSGLIAQQDEYSRQGREDARSVCHDQAAVKRFHELSRCVQKRVSDLGKQLSSATTAQMAQSHASHLKVLKEHLEIDKSSGILSPDQIPAPTTSSRDRQDRVHPLKPVLSRPDPKRGQGGRGGNPAASPRVGSQAGRGRGSAPPATKRKAPTPTTAAKRQNTAQPGSQAHQQAQQAMQAYTQYQQQSAVSGRTNEAAKQAHATQQQLASQHAAAPDAQKQLLAPQMQAAQNAYAQAKQAADQQQALLNQAHTNWVQHNQSLQQNPPAQQVFSAMQQHHHQQQQQSAQAQAQAQAQASAQAAAQAQAQANAQAHANAQAQQAAQHAAQQAAQAQAQAAAQAQAQAAAAAAAQAAAAAAAASQAQSTAQAAATAVSQAAPGKPKPEPAAAAVAETQQPGENAAVAVAAQKEQAKVEKDSAAGSQSDAEAAVKLSAEASAKAAAEAKDKAGKSVQEQKAAAPAKQPPQQQQLKQEAGEAAGKQQGQEEEENEEDEEEGEDEEDGDGDKEEEAKPTRGGRKAATKKDDSKGKKEAPKRATRGMAKEAATTTRASRRSKR